MVAGAIELGQEDIVETDPEALRLSCYGISSIYRLNDGVTDVVDRTPKHLRELLLAKSLCGQKTEEEERSFSHLIHHGLTLAYAL
jgi:hypothetical protein